MMKQFNSPPKLAINRKEPVASSPHVTPHVALDKFHDLVMWGLLAASLFFCFVWTMFRPDGGKGHEFLSG